jgi:hypothetical protein
MDAAPVLRPDPPSFLDSRQLEVHALLEFTCDMTLYHS